MTVLTTAQVELLTSAQLVVFWNENCAKVSKPAVKKFATRDAGIKRCEELAVFLRAEAKAAAAKPGKAPKTAKAPKAEGETKLSVSAHCQALIRQGKTNAEVWAIVQPAHNLADSKKTYPGWYRAQMRRNGQIK